MEMARTKNMRPLVVVQLLVYNEPIKVIETLLSSLSRVQYPTEKWKIVIVNNVCAGHDLGAYIRSHWTKIPGMPELLVEIQNPNLGFAGGHNRAWRLSQTFHPDFLYLLNADAHVDPFFLQNIVNEAQRLENAAIIQSRIMLSQEPHLFNSRGNALHFLGFGFSLGYRQTPEAVNDLALPMFYASGAGVLIRANILEKIGGLFDASYFMYHEDVDLSWRARLAGYDIGYADDSVIFHQYQFSKSIKKFYWMERNRHLTNFACYSLKTLLLISPAYVIMELGTIFFALRSGWAKEKMRSLAHLCKPSTWKWIFARRKLIAGLRVKSDKELLEHMVGVIINQEIDQPLLTRIVNPMLQYYFCILRRIF